MLVSSPFESNPNFFYPTPVERVDFQPWSRPAAAGCWGDANVMLADIPFVRLVRWFARDAATRGGELQRRGEASSA